MEAKNAVNFVRPNHLTRHQIHLPIAKPRQLLCLDDAAFVDGQLAFRILKFLNFLVSLNRVTNGTPQEFALELPFDEVVLRARFDRLVTDDFVVDTRQNNDGNVLATSNAEQDIQKTYNLEVNAYINKPVDFDRFFDIVQKIEDFWLMTAILPSSLK